MRISDWSSDVCSSDLPDTGEQALEIVDTLVRSNAIDVLVIDSVAALVPREEIEGEMGDSHVGLQARLMSQSLRKLTGSISRSRCMVIFINQLRMKIGVMYGNPETTTGGNRTEEHTSELQSIMRNSYAVFCVKKKKKTKKNYKEIMRYRRIQPHIDIS